MILIASTCGNYTACLATELEACLPPPPPLLQHTHRGELAQL